MRLVWLAPLAPGVSMSFAARWLGVESPSPAHRERAIRRNRVREPHDAGTTLIQELDVAIHPVDADALSILDQADGIHHSHHSR